MKKLVVTTAIAFDEQERVAFEEKAMKTFGESEFEYHVDEELIGGVIIFDGERVYDGTVQSKIQRISDLLKKD